MRKIEMVRWENLEEPTPPVVRWSALRRQGEEPERRALPNPEAHMPHDAWEPFVLGGYRQWTELYHPKRASADVRSEEMGLEEAVVVSGE